MFLDVIVFTKCAPLVLRSYGKQQLAPTNAQLQARNQMPFQGLVSENFGTGRMSFLRREEEKKIGFIYEENHKFSAVDKM